MSLKNAVLFSVLTAVCCQIQIPISSQDINPIFRDFNPGLTDFSLPRLNLGEEPELPDVADSLCLAKIKGLYSGLATFNQESIAFFDAAGKPGPGLTQGNLLMMGGYDMCLSIKNATSGYYNFCYVGAPGKLFGYPIRIDWTGCLPAECRNGSNTDVEKWISSFIPFGQLVLEPGTMNCETEVELGTGAILGYVYLGIVAFLVVLGTLWYTCHPVILSIISTEPPQDRQVLVNCEENIYNEIVPDTPQEGQSADKPAQPPSAAQPEQQTESLVSRFWKCFALQRSFGTLTSTTTKPGQVLCLNGIRVLSINWVVLGHTYLNYMGLLGDKMYLLTLLNRRNSPIIINANPSVDSFFALSGFLVAYLLLKQLAKSGGPKEMGAAKWVAYYLHRYLRLTAPYLMVVLLEGFLYRQWVTGPLTFAMDGPDKACQDYWWANILYINNLVPWKATEVCVGQTWYLSNDMQFYLIAPVFVVLLFWKPLAGIITSVAVILSSTVATAIITYHYKLGPASAADLNADNFWLIYNKPWIRIKAYLVGILGGWIYWKYGQILQDRVKKMPEWKKVLVAGPIWAATCAIQWAVVFGLYDDIKNARLENKQPGEADSISYSSLARIAWSTALTVQILLCQSGLGGFVNSILSWNGWLVLARLTYSVYLLHLGLLRVLAVILRHPFYFNPDFELGVKYLGILMMSYLAATILYVCVEQPLSFLEAITYRR